MIVFLDARALLWWCADAPELGQAARRTITNTANDVVVSAGTVWEIAVKRAAGRLDAPPNLLETLEAQEFGVVSVTGEDAVTAAELPPHHRDPFDRMLVAQAQRLEAVIITRDRAFDAYGVNVITA